MVGNRLMREIHGGRRRISDHTKKRIVYIKSDCQVVSKKHVKLLIKMY